MKKIKVSYAAQKFSDTAASFMAVLSKMLCPGNKFSIKLYIFLYFIAQTKFTVIKCEKYKEL